MHINNNNITERNRTCNKLDLYLYIVIQHTKTTYQHNTTKHFLVSKKQTPVGTTHCQLLEETTLLAITNTFNNKRYPITLDATTFYIDTHNQFRISNLVRKIAFMPWENYNIVSACFDATAMHECSQASRNG